MTRRNHEAELQKDLVRTLRLILPRGSLVWHVPNGGKMSDAARMRRAAMGEVPGVSDLMFLVPTTPLAGLLHCIECKVQKDPLRGIKRTTHQTEEQCRFQAGVEACGARYAVARSTDDLRAILHYWHIPTREAKTATSGQFSRSQAVEAVE